MNLPKGIYAIPPGIDCDAVFADSVSKLNGKSARERVFYMINELMAESRNDGSDEALNELAAILGSEATHPTEPATIEKARIRARRAAREACTHALEAGYNP